MRLDNQLKQRIQEIIDSEDLVTERATVSAIAEELGLDFFDCAAALMHLVSKKTNSHSESQTKQQPVLTEAKSVSALPSLSDIPKMIRYRVEIGRRHSVSKEEVINVLVEESGVDPKMIGAIEIHNNFSVLELPEGMPGDIFQHLKSVEINQQKLHFKHAGKGKNKRRGGFVKRARNRNSQTQKDFEEPI